MNDWHGPEVDFSMRSNDLSDLYALDALNESGEWLSDKQVKNKKFIMEEYQSEKVDTV